MQFTDRSEGYQMHLQQRRRFVHVELKGTENLESVKRMDLLEDRK